MARVYKLKPFGALWVAHQSTRQRARVKSDKGVIGSCYGSPQVWNGQLRVVVPSANKVRWRSVGQKTSGSL
jgi:hypothetical protein